MRDTARSRKRDKSEKGEREKKRKNTRMGMLNEQHANSERNEPGPFPFQFHWPDKLKEITNCSNALDYARNLSLFLFPYVMNED